MDALVPIVIAVMTVVVVLRIVLPGAGRVQDREISNSDLQRPVPDAELARIVPGSFRIAA